MNEDLLELLRGVWSDTHQGKQTVDYLDVYGLYENSDTKSRKDITTTYATTLAMQKLVLPKPKPDPVLANLSKNITDTKPPRGGGLDLGKGGYIWFASPRFQEDGARERVVLHTYPYERVVATWSELEKTIMKAEGPFSGVNSGKFMKQDCYQSGRHDTIIIYTKDKTTRDEVIREIRRLIANGTFKQGQFINPLPRGLKAECAGIGYGTEPPNIYLLDTVASKPSYGKYLGAAISIAVSIAVVIGVNKWVDFNRLCAYVLMMVGFDPAEPSSIHEMDPALVASIPWYEPDSGTTKEEFTEEYQKWLTDTPLYKAILKEKILR